MSQTALAAADDFIRNETQFHLGFLPTEQSNPDTVTLGEDFQTDPVKGVATLQKADRDVLKMAKRVLASKEFAAFFNDGLNTIKNGGRVIFSGCGATGRLSILLECMYREGCSRYPELAQYSNSVFSIMTGGDYALVRSVEFFEDYQSFGRQQVRELDLQANDMLVAITEGGETSSVLGTLFEALDRGCQGFLLFNNPADLLAAHLERSRRAITASSSCQMKDT
jgi:N-acetylmuramic acid 6-phosphate etherase